MNLNGLASEEAINLVQLHNHSEYSLMDGAIRIKDLITKAKSLNHQAIALTDHGNMFAAVDFYQEAKNNGIKPILGCEIFQEGSGLSKVLVAKNHSAFHLPLLAKSFDGYKSLIKIVSYGYNSSDTPIPIVSNDDLKQHTKDLIALSGCLKGEFGFLVSRLFQSGKDPIKELDTPTTEDNQKTVLALKKHVLEMKQIFGDSNYYIELTDNNLKPQKQIIPLLAECAEYFNLPIVATSDAHYLNEDDVEAHSVLTAIKNDLKMTDIRSKINDATFHFYSNNEMKEKFGRWPKALSNTVKIAEQCNIEIPFGKFYLPNFELSENQDPSEALAELSKIGLQERLKLIKPKDESIYWKRLKYELDVIISMGFPGYFLIVQDFINWAKKNNIPVGPGRGSGAGSIVAYALNITDLDPIPLNLIFERFLNPDRISMPDFDVDFCQNRRDEVIKYVTQKYGKTNVAQITTFGKMKAKAAIRDVGRVLELSYTKVDRIAKLIPNELDIKLKDALEQEPRLNEEMKKDSLIDDMIQLALKLEGLARHTSVHAAGVVISEGGMENFVPVHKTEDGTLVTQYEMKNAEKVGLVKFDFLGLKTLTVVEKAVQLVNMRYNLNLKIDQIPLEERKVYEMISTGHTTGLFQLESSGMKSLVVKLKPSRFEDIIAIVALFRPGPLGSGMVDDFIERKHGRQEITYPLKELEPILKDTYGIILYQEQVQKIAASLANYTLGEADILRRAMGKKKPEEMAKQKSRFLKGCEENQINPQIADDIFELMAKFASYGFNKSHSAAYGLVSYQTSYLKTFYPEEFMAAIMSCDIDNTEKIVRYIEECRRLKFKILPPDINRSFIEFDVPDKKHIGFALLAIKGIGENSLKWIIDERKENGPFESLTNLAKRVPLQKVGKKNIELLIQMGAFDQFDSNRLSLCKIVSDLVKFSEEHHTAKGVGQISLFGDSDESTDIDEDLFYRSNSILIENKMEKLLIEKKLVGVFLTSHPISIYKKEQEKYNQCNLSQLDSHIGNKDLTIVCFLSDLSTRFTKKTNKKFIFFKLEDEFASVEALSFDLADEEDLPEKNTPVKVSFAVSKSFKGEDLNIKVNSLETVESTRVKIKQAKILIDLKNPETEKKIPRYFQQLSKNILNHPGETSLKISIVYRNAAVNISSIENKVELNNSFFESLEKLKPYGFDLNY